MSFTHYNKSIQQCNFCKTMVPKGASSCYMCHDKPVTQKYINSRHEYFATEQPILFANNDKCEKCNNYCLEQSKKYWKCFLYLREIFKHKKSPDPNEKCLYCGRFEYEKLKISMNELIDKDIKIIKKITDKNMLKKILISIIIVKISYDENINECMMVDLSDESKKNIQDLCEKELDNVHLMIENRLKNQIYYFNLEFVKLTDKKIISLIT